MGLYHYWLMMIVVFIELCLYTSNSQHLTCHPSDQEALSDFINELVPYKEERLALNFSGNCCEWAGMTCTSSSSLGLNDPNSTARVTKVEIRSTHLWGVLSESLGRLHQLKVLNLSNNQISGSIPPSISNLVNLEILDLSSNVLSGHIPQNLKNLPSLKFLDLSSNTLSGSLSPLGNLSSLVHLDVSRNQFSGDIPDVFNKLSELKILLAYDNQFTGGIPKSLANAQSLVFLNLGYNSLSGPLRLNCDAMTNLTSLDLASNQFNGSLPDNLPSCRNLRNVYLAENLFNGQVPESFKDFHSLFFLSLTNCKLVNISAAVYTLQHCKNLTTLVLSNNFMGEMLVHDRPSLHFEKLKVLIVQDSGLNGPLPSWLSKSTNLQVLDLARNGFTGAIPNWIGGFSNLFYLDLSGNSLTGEIPKSLTTLQSLSSRDISFDEASLLFPFLFTWNKYEELALDFSQNSLSGPIWKEFGNLKKLQVFNLGANTLSGSIPSELSGMTSLEVLDLSNNGLSGSIPVSLQGLSSLSFFNVANNNLSGIYPSGGRFSTFSSRNFEGNHLCRDDLFLSQCQTDANDADFVPDFTYNKQSRTSVSDYFLDFTYGLALGYGLALIIVAALTWSSFQLPGSPRK